MASILIFELGSLICGTSPNSTALIVGRAIAGIGSAGIFAGSFIIIACSVPLVKRAKYGALLGAMYGIASVAGPLLGGAFTDHLTWRWCFYINRKSVARMRNEHPYPATNIRAPRVGMVNASSLTLSSPVPLGGVVLAGIIIFFKPVAPNPALVALPRKAKLKQLDALGTILFVASVSCLFIALQWGGVKYGWMSGQIVILLFFFAITGIAWIYVQYRRGESATLPGRIIKQRSIAAGAFTSFCVGGAFFVLLYYVAIWFQAVKSRSAVSSGISSLPMVLGLTIGMTIAGQTQQYVNRIPPYMIVSAVLTSIGSGLIYTWTPSSGQGAWIGYQALFGLGQGVGWQQPFSIAQSFLETKDLPVGTTLMSGCKLFGGAIFISVASSVFSQHLVKNLDAIGGLDVAGIVAAGATDLKSTVTAAQLPQVIDAYNDALRHVFVVSVILSCLAIIGSLVVEWKPIKKKEPRQKPDDA